MMSHFFIAPRDIFSPRWQQAFADAVVTEDVAIATMGNNIVWLLIRDEASFARITELSATGAKVIALTAIEHPAEARAALEAGASGYLHYLAIPQVLEQVAAVVTAGGMWLGAELMRQLVQATARMISPGAEPLLSADLSLLTLREKAVAELVAAGKTNKEIARELDITERTVKAHLGSVFDKLKVRDRLQLVLMFR